MQTVCGCCPDEFEFCKRHLVAMQPLILGYCGLLLDGCIAHDTSKIKELDQRILAYVKTFVPPDVDTNDLLVAVRSLSWKEYRLKRPLVLEPILGQPPPDWWIKEQALGQDDEKGDGQSSAEPYKQR